MPYLRIIVDTRKERMKMENLIKRAKRGDADAFTELMQPQMNVSEEQMIELQNLQDTPVSFPGVSDRQGDITVSVAQCVMDKNDLKIGFYVEGYELESNVEPQLDSISILLDGQVVYNYEWSFFNGIDWDENDNPIMADDSLVQEDAEVTGEQEITMKQCYAVFVK